MFTLSPVRHDGWIIHLTALCGLSGEIFDPPTRTVLIDPTSTSLEVAAAHAIAHLNMKHHLTEGDFTEDQCDDADREAVFVLAASSWVLQTFAEESPPAVLDQQHF